MSPLLSLAEAAKVLKVSLRQVRRYVDEGRLPVCRISERTVRIRQEDLCALVSASITQGTPQVH